MRRLPWAVCALLGLAALQACSYPAVPGSELDTTPASTLQASATPTAIPSPTLTITSTVTPTPTVTPTATAVPLATATPGPTPSGGVSLAMVGLSQRTDGKVTSLGILLADLNSGQSRSLLGEEYRLQDYSASGGLLVSRGPELWVARLDGVLQVEITSQLFTGGYPSAIWINGSQAVAFISAGPSGREVAFASGPAYTRDKTVSPESAAAFALYPAGQGRLAWEYGDCTPSACTAAGSRVFSPGPGAPLDLPGKLRPQVSPDGRLLAYTYFDDEQKSRLGILSLDGAFDRHVRLEGDHIMAYAWQPQGDYLSVLNLVRSDYSGRWFGINHFLVSPTNWSVRQLKAVDGVNAQVFWSPDGMEVIIPGTVQTGAGYQVALTREFLHKNSAEGILSPPGFASDGFILLDRLAWVAN